MNRMWDHMAAGSSATQPRTSRLASSHLRKNLSMNLFLSWSGNLSHEIAKALVWWIPQVLQAVKPWISSQDIEKGARWFEEIGESLSTTDFGILCLTASNLSAPWILFEAGALSKSLGQARVCPLLVNTKNADLVGPLAQFNTSGIAKVEIRGLIESLNVRLPPEVRRADVQLGEAFEVWWPKLEQRFKEALAASGHEESGKSVAPKRKIEDVLDEVLELSRTSAQHLARLNAQSNTEPDATPRGWPLGSVGAFANQVGRPVSELVAQLNSIGLTKTSALSPLTEDDKEKFLEFLRGGRVSGIRGTKQNLFIRPKESSRGGY
jgi:TIR domain